MGGLTVAFDLATPIVSAGRALSGTRSLAAAVSKAGGMGFLTGDLMLPSQVEEDIRAAREVTSRALGMSFTTPLATEDHMKACMNARPAVVAFAHEPPKRRWVGALHDVGVSVWLEVRSPSDARRAAKEGFDAVIARAKQRESHWSSTNLVALLPAVSDAAGPLPLLAAGGVSDGRGLAAALALGADAVWCEKRFLASSEARLPLRHELIGFEDDSSGSAFASACMHQQRRKGILAGGVGDRRTGFGDHRPSLSELWMDLPKIELFAPLVERGFGATQRAERAWNVKSAAAILREMSDEADEAFAALLALVSA